MRIMYKLILIFLLIADGVWGQRVKGFIYDAGNKEPLMGVNVYFKDKAGMQQGTVSDMDGAYELAIQEGSVLLNFSYLGYETVTEPVRVAQGKTLTKDIFMKINSNIMDEVVVSVGRYEQKLSDVTVSMELLKAKDITRQSPKDLTDVLKNIPGVDVTDRQPSVRGGTGWTYGVGSRCLILVDGMSVLTPGSGEINWNMIPMENVDQVEVLKGASSVLYGSSALNGLIHVRTKRPSLEPQTQINLRGGMYGQPNAGGTPMFGGLDASHTRRINNFDLSIGANALLDDGFREDNHNRRVRVGGNLTYNDPTVKGLSYGTNINYMYDDFKDFFMWRSADEPLKPSPLAGMGRRENTIYIDPFLNYTNSEKQTTHRFRGRFFYRGNDILTTTSGKSLLDITSNMGFDMNSVPEIVGMVQNWQTTLLPTFLPYLPDVMNGNVNGLMGELGKLGNRYFPKADSGDYLDLISWVMQHTPLPNQDNMGAWLVDAMKPGKKETTSSGTDHTYAYNLDYQFSKKFEYSQYTVGGTYERIRANSNVTGIHTSDNVALFMQYDHKLFERLNVSAGLRLEYYRVDDAYREAETKIFGAKVPVKPVFRAGLNYELAEASFIRASFGQGYRYPSVTEKFVLKDVGGVGVFPNSNLKAEQGYNAELGFKQGYQWGKLRGFADVAGFYTRYKDMIEFRFGMFDKTSFGYIDSVNKLVNAVTNGGGIGFGAQFFNAGRAEIYGVDVSTSGAYEFNPTTRLTYNVGYVFTNPIDMDQDARRAEEDANTDMLAMRLKSNDSKYLKFRQKHNVKAVFDFEWKRYNIGTNMVWKSKILAADYFMVDEREKAEPELMDYMRSLLFGDLHNYWKDVNKGYFLMDVRAGVRMSKGIHLQALVNNIWNKRYSNRPMDVGTPRTFIVQLGVNF